MTCFYLRAFRFATRCPGGQRKPASGAFRQLFARNQPARSEAERAGIEIRPFRSLPTATPPPSNAGIRSFKRRGKTQGRRGFRRRTGRFARPPYSRTGVPPVRPKRFFSSTGRGAFSFWRPKKRMGGASPRGPRHPSRPAGKQTGSENTRQRCRSRADPPSASTGARKIK